MDECATVLVRLKGSNRFRKPLLEPRTGAGSNVFIYDRICSTVEYDVSGRRLDSLHTQKHNSTW